MRHLLASLLLAAGLASAQTTISGPAGMVMMTAGPKPLSAVLEAVGRQVRPNVLVLPGVPDVQVDYSLTAIAPQVAFDAIVSAHGLAYCAGAGLLLVGGAESVGHACAAVPNGKQFPAVPVAAPAPVAVPVAAPAAPVVAAPAPVQRVAVRVRVLELADNSAAAGGVDWSAGLLPALVNAGVAAVSGGSSSVSSASVASSISALERQGLARKLDEVELSLTSGQTTDFQSGGNLQLSLIGAGTEKIERTIPYGLNLHLTPTFAADGLSVAVSADLANAVSTSNPSLLDVAKRSVTSNVSLADKPVLVASWLALRDESNGAGLPALSRAPFVGYVAGRSDQSSSRSTLLVLLERV